MDDFFSWITAGANFHKCKNFYLQADNILQTLSEYLQPGFDINLDVFRKKIAKDSTFVPYGELIYSYTRTNGEKLTCFVESCCIELYCFIGL